MTPSFVPTLLHLLFWHTPRLPRPLSFGLGSPPRPGLFRSFSLGPGLQRPTFELLKLGLLRPLPQCDGLVQPGLNHPEPSLACGELAELEAGLEHFCSPELFFYRTSLTHWDERKYSRTFGCSNSNLSFFFLNMWAFILESNYLGGKQYILFPLIRNSFYFRFQGFFLLFTCFRS